MSGQTENYIILKPIAERFNDIAKNISDKDIENIIKDTLREQLKNVFDFSRIEEFTEEYIDENEDVIKDLIFKSIKDKLK